MGNLKQFLVSQFITNATSFENSWRKALLLAIPFAMIAILIGIWFEYIGQQTNLFDRWVYPTTLGILMLSWSTLALNKLTPRQIVMVVIGEGILYLLAKQFYVLFIMPNGINPPLELAESLFWTPFVYILCFFVSSGYGSRLAGGFTLASLALSLVYIARQVSGDNIPYTTIGLLIQFNLSNLTQFLLSFAFVNLKDRYSQTKDKVSELKKVAHTDSLTGLPNRLVLQKALEKALLNARDKEQKVAVFFIDIDRFKLINDTLGHQTGDLLLELVSKRLKHTVNTGDFVARISGDEFVIISRKIDRPQAVSMLAAKILSAFSKPFELAGQSLNVTISVGSSLFPDDATDAETLLRNADSAMYKVKKHGKNGVMAYEKVEDNLEHRWQLEKDLRVALEQRQLSLHYQPMYDLQSGKLVKFESLLRWKHPEKGFISPAEFIPLAEESGMIVTLGAWVLEEACRQAKAWVDLGLPYKVSVNVSLLQFSHPNFVLAVLNAVKETGLLPTYLELEITESVLMSQPTEVNKILMRLKDEGIQLAMDDFGTGYSSLAYLRDLPIDTVKIDKSFVQKLDAQNTEPFSRALVETIVGLAKHLDLEVVAEGVETAEQVEMLKQLGCNIGQGYYFSKPIPPNDLERFILKLRQSSKPRVARVA
jgi:diguanylate cyclase (GGDEF)-like protein